MNILIITQYFWPENFKINDFAESFQKKGHNITVLTGIPNYPEGKFYDGYGLFNPKNESYKNIKIIRSWQISRGKGNSLRLFLNYFSFAFFASFSSLARLKSDYDVIFVFEVSPVTVGIPALVLKKIRKIPIFFWVQDLWPESVYAAGNLKKRYFEKYLTKLVRYIYYNCDRIFVSSRGFIKSIIEKGVDLEKIEYIPVWAEDVFFENYNPSEFHKLSSILPSQFFNIVFAGNIGEAQDFESIINAVSYLRNYKAIKWYIIGDGRKREWLKNEIEARSLGDNIVLPGRYPLNTIPYFYSKADVLILALKDEYIFSLTVPAKLQTYLTSGKPIVAMINGEAANIINESGSGFASNSGDYVSFSENILKVYKMPDEERTFLGDNAKMFYKNNFDKEKILEKVESLFQNYSEGK
ncbi:MAG: glycosyltransferase family 4 protein [Bacteroidales bacterium]|nr:glycosyltransferase family 4 protein [Bacteroidales bacterium]